MHSPLDVPVTAPHSPPLCPFKVSVQQRRASSTPAHIRPDSRGQGPAGPAWGAGPAPGWPRRRGAACSGGSGRRTWDLSGCGRESTFFFCVPQTHRDATGVFLGLKGHVHGLRPRRAPCCSGCFHTRRSGWMMGQSYLRSLVSFRKDGCVRVWTEGSSGALAV